MPILKQQPTILILTKSSLCKASNTLAMKKIHNLHSTLNLKMQQARQALPTFFQKLILN